MYNITLSSMNHIFTQIVTNSHVSFLDRLNKYKTSHKTVQGNWKLFLRRLLRTIKIEIKKKTYHIFLQFPQSVIDLPQPVLLIPLLFGIPKHLFSWSYFHVSIIIMKVRFLIKKKNSCTGWKCTVIHCSETNEIWKLVLLLRQCFCPSKWHS